jgi:sigma-B regulation protein RsbU (phosphoserine phosphatase)
MFFGVLDLARGELTFVNAGHNPPILSRDDGTIVRLQSTGPVAGIFANATYEAVTIELRECDRLVIYSDGVTEYHNRAGEEFGEARLDAVLLREAGKPAEETCRAIVDGLHAFGGERPYDDDVTMLVLCRAPAPDSALNATVSLQSPSEAHHAIRTAAVMAS